MIENVDTTTEVMPRSGGRQKMISRKGLNALKYLENEKKKNQIKKASKLSSEGARRSRTSENSESADASTRKAFQSPSVGARISMTIEESESEDVSTSKAFKAQSVGARRSRTSEESESEDVPTSKAFKAQSVGARRSMTIEESKSETPTSKVVKAQSVGARRSMTIEESKSETPTSKVVKAQSVRSRRSMINEESESEENDDTQEVAPSNDLLLQDPEFLEFCKKAFLHKTQKPRPAPEVAQLEVSKSSICGSSNKVAKDDPDSPDSRPIDIETFRDIPYGTYLCSNEEIRTIIAKLNIARLLRVGLKNHRDPKWPNLLRMMELLNKYGTDAFKERHYDQIAVYINQLRIKRLFDRTERLEVSCDKSIRNEFLSLLKVVCEPLFGVYFPNRGFQIEADYIVRVNMIASKVSKEIFKSRTYVIKPGTLSQLHLYSLTDIENEIKGVHRSRTKNSVRICSKVLKIPMKEGYDFIIHYH
jgi:hypothetical protein